VNGGPRSGTTGPAGRLPFTALDLAFLSAAFALAYAVKRGFSEANADELAFLLRPTAWLVELVTGYGFTLERGAGYVNQTLAVAIAPACSGTNFLLVAFVTLILAFLPRLATLRAKSAWFAASVATSYLATLAANSLRISLGLAAKHLVPQAWLSAHAVHRALGVAVYLGCLLALFTLVERAVRGAPRRAAQNAFLIPLALYLVVTLLVPLLRGAAARPEYGAHAAVVLAAVTVAMLCLRVRRDPARTRTSSWRAEHPIPWREPVAGSTPSEFRA
jgi:exosortase K